MQAASPRQRLIEFLQIQSARLLLLQGALAARHHSLNMHVYLFAPTFEGLWLFQPLGWTHAT